MKNAALTGWRWGMGKILAYDSPCCPLPYKINIRKPKTLRHYMFEHHKTTQDCTSNSNTRNKSTLTECPALMRQTNAIQIKITVLLMTPKLTRSPPNSDLASKVANELHFNCWNFPAAIKCPYLLCCPVVNI